MSLKKEVIDYIKDWQKNLIYKSSMDKRWKGCKEYYYLVSVLNFFGIMPFVAYIT